MKSALNSLPKEMRRVISLVSRLCPETNSAAYLVGGIVRDLLLGVKNLDLDIVVEPDGLKMAVELAACLDAKLTIHPRFATARLLLPGKTKLDIAPRY